ncbi:glycoside hydrolase family 172 protein [Streptomyces sp. NBC_00009]|uniref:glycoside hydrolase family 172 protein n=1 Tax=Streptomyces sp. NBC_00009 TaxID=2975620 RepID=UPI0032455504
MPSLDHLTQTKKARTVRVSSWDQRGRNQDYWTTPAHSTRLLADIEGPGRITHIWMTQFCRQTFGPGLIDPLEADTVAPVMEIHNALGVNWEEPDPDYYRKVLLRITWDDEEQPAVLVPLGDYFGVGHSMPNSYESALFTVSAKPEESLIFGGSAALNCWAPMPFNKRAKIEIVNENDLPLQQYFYVDYELYPEQLPADTLYFHAKWNRSNPCNGWAPDLQTNSPEVNIVDDTGEDNYVVLDVEGTGHYVGCNLSVFHRQGSWWGEGNDMIWIDDDFREDGSTVFPPSLHGTGTEDYFNHAWGMQKNAYLYHGAIIHEGDVPGYAVNYRQHVVDPVRFEERIKVSIEHGHGNHLSDDWASTAYWYQTLPSPPASILPLADRLPVRPAAHPRPEPSPRHGTTAEEIVEMRAAYEVRWQRYQERLAERTRQRGERSLAESQANARHSADLRRRYDAYNSRTSSEN